MESIGVKGGEAMGFINQLKYQFKSIRGDKLCIMTFLLPVLIGIAVQFLSEMDFQEMGETMFGCVEGTLPKETERWLRQYGRLSVYGTMDGLRAEVNNPSTQMIGVIGMGDGIGTLLAGDELALYDSIGRSLPQLYENRAAGVPFTETRIPVPVKTDGLKSLLLVMTLVTAMFMGCTFNAMNIIGEKEDGVALVNQLLPMTARTYLLQKFLLGFVGGLLSTLITALVCVRIALNELPLFLVFIFLSAYIASLLGLLIGAASSGMMTGILYIKMTLLLFLAIPVFMLFPRASRQHDVSTVLSVSLKRGILWNDGAASGPNGRTWALCNSFGGAYSGVERPVPVSKKSVSPVQPFCAAHVFSCHLSCAGSCRTASAFSSRRCLPQHQQGHMPQKRSAAAGCNMDSLDHRRLCPAIPHRRDKPTHHTCRFV